jgi:D-aminopeptidase
MICYGFKGGIGTSSRKLDDKAGGYTVGVLVQANFGRRAQLRIAGVPVGTEITENQIAYDNTPRFDTDVGSIIIVVATDAPLLAHQLKRLARRAALGVARTGSSSGNGSGDIFIAFSTANSGAASAAVAQLTMLSNNRVDRIFEATVQATEEAIINAIVAAETMTGIDNHKVFAISHERLKEVLKKYNRLNESR